MKRGENMKIAHICDDGKEQSVKEHLENTAILSRKFGDKFDSGDYAYICGLLHDIGKYSQRFQERIRGKDIRVDHSTAGAQEIDKAIKNFGKLLAYCIAGHHGGLPNGGSASDTEAESSLCGRLNKSLEDDYSCFAQEIDLRANIPASPPKLRLLNKGGFTVSFYIRMLYSCLVDADFLDTESFISAGSVDRTSCYNMELFHMLLNKYIAYFDKSEREINKKRREILSACINKAKLEKGLYTLTVPTGGGKTVSSFAFALHHVIEHKMDRIIYVIPYTSIIEQNAGVFKKILGEENVLEHHVNFDFSDEDENKILQKQKLSSENWDMPVIVTTNVQFFESLFANKSSRCRKLHNIANSVIIFDEAQMLPIDYLKPCIMSIAELIHNYGSTAVLCTATQPAVDGLFPKEIASIEICENTKQLYEFFKRIKVKLRGDMGLQSLSEDLNSHKQVLCIVNTKKQALKIFDEIKGDDAFHLSTSMCPAHRKLVIAEIKSRLKKEMPCRVVSTQLIEAGVDVDFPIVYRAIAGIDSIVQAAGRCNREGKRAFGEVFVFEPQDELKTRLPYTLQRPLEITKSIIRRYDDIMQPEAIEAYFKELYGMEGESGLDIKNIFKDLEGGAIGCNFNFPFKDVAEQFTLIEDHTYPIIIPFDDKAKHLIEKLKYADQYGGILRSLQSYSVNVYETSLKNLLANGTIRRERDEIYILNDEKQYDEMTGLNLTCETGNGIFV